MMFSPLFQFIIAITLAPVLNYAAVPGQERITLSEDNVPPGGALAQTLYIDPKVLSQSPLTSADFAIVVPAGNDVQEGKGKIVFTVPSLDIRS